MLWSSTSILGNQSSCWPLNVNIFTYQSTNHLVWPDISITSTPVSWSPFETAASVMIFVHGDCYLTLQISLERTVCFLCPFHFQACSVLKPPPELQTTHFRGAKGANKFIRPGTPPAWLLCPDDLFIPVPGMQLLFQLAGLPVARVPCIQDT